MKKIVCNAWLLLLFIFSFTLFFSCKKMQRRAGLTNGSVTTYIETEKELYIKSFEITNYNAMILIEHESANTNEGLITIVVEENKFDKNQAIAQIELFNPQATVSPTSGSRGIPSEYVINYKEESMIYKTVIKEVPSVIIATYIKNFTVTDLAGRVLTAQIDHADGLQKGKILVYLDEEELSSMPPKIILFNPDSEINPKQESAVDGLIYTVTSGAGTEKKYELSIEQRISGDANLYIKNFLVPQALDVTIDHTKDQIVVLMQEGVLAANPNIIPIITLVNPSISELKPEAQLLQNNQIYTVQLINNPLKYKRYTVIIKEMDAALAAENYLHIKTFRFSNNSGIIGVDIDHRQAGQDGHIIVTVQEGKWTSPIPTPRIDLYQPQTSNLTPNPQPLQDGQSYIVTSRNDGKSKNYKVFVRELPEDAAQEVSLHIRDFSFQGIGSDFALGVDINHGALGGDGLITVLVEEGKIANLPIPFIELYSLYATELNPKPQPLQRGQVYAVNLISDRTKIKRYTVQVHEIPANLAQEVSLYIKNLNFSPQDQAKILNINIDHDTEIIQVEIQENSLSSIASPDVILFNPTAAELISPVLGTAFVDGLKYRVAVKTDHNKFKEYTVKIKEIDAVGAIERNVQMKSFEVAGVFATIDHKNDKGEGEILLVLESNLTNNSPIVTPYNQFATVTPPATGLTHGAKYRISYQGEYKDYVLNLIIIQEDDLHIATFDINGQIVPTVFDHGLTGTDTGKITLAVEEKNLATPNIVLKKPHLAEISMHTRTDIGTFYTVQHQYANKSKAYKLDLTVIQDIDTQIESFQPSPDTYVAQVSIDHGTPATGGFVNITVKNGTIFNTAPVIILANSNATLNNAPNSTVNGAKFSVTYAGLTREYTIRITQLGVGDCAIFTAQDFDDIRNKLTADCKLYKDIDLSIYPNWIPIDNFEGTLDAQGFTVSGLLIDNTLLSNVGLFGDLKAKEIKDLTLEIIYVNSTQQYTGALAGTLSGSGKVSRVTVKGGPVRGNATVGGLIGHLNTSTGIQDVAVTISVISGNNLVAGLVGQLTAGYIQTSYAAPISMSSTISSNIFGLVGQGPSIPNPGLVTNSYYPHTFINSTSYGTSLNIATANQNSFGSSWDFVNVWEWVGNGQWPRLRKKN